MNIQKITRTLLESIQAIIEKGIIYEVINSYGLHKK